MTLVPCTTILAAKYAEIGRVGVLSDLQLQGAEAYARTILTEMAEQGTLRGQRISDDLSMIAEGALETLGETGQDVIKGYVVGVDFQSGNMRFVDWTPDARLDL